MDTSEQYIKMCEKAEVIQEDWLPMKGDYAFNRGKNFMFLENYKQTLFWSKAIDVRDPWLIEEDEVYQELRSGVVTNINGWGSGHIGFENLKAIEITRLPDGQFWAWAKYEDVVWRA